MRHCTARETLGACSLVAFMRAYPEIILDLDFSDQIVDVIEEDFDAVVRAAEVGDSTQDRPSRPGGMCALC